MIFHNSAANWFRYLPKYFPEAAPTFAVQRATWSSDSYPCNHLPLALLLPATSVILSRHWMLKVKPQIWRDFIVFNDTKFVEVNMPETSLTLQKSGWNAQEFTTQIHPFYRHFCLFILISVACPEFPIPSKGRAGPGQVRWSKWRSALLLFNPLNRQTPCRARVSVF